MITNILTGFTMFSAMVTKLALLNVSMIQQDIVLVAMLLLYFVKRVSYVILNHSNKYAYVYPMAENRI